MRCLHRRGVLVALSLALFATLCTWLYLKTYAFPPYLDEVVYVDCGLRYVSGTPPYLCNFEHPPFAKYLIGFFSLLGLARYFYAFLLICSCFLVYGLVRRLGYGFAWLPAVLLFFDTVYFNTFRFLLLDPSAVFFSLLGLYLLLGGRARLSAVSLGLALGSKLSSAPVLLGALYLVYRGRGARALVLYLFIASAVYLATYGADLLLGFDAIVVHHVEMLRYMSWRHGFSLPIALNGFLKLLTRVEFWRYAGNVTIVLGNVSGTYTVVERILEPVDRNLVVVGVGLGSLLWYTLFPVLLYSTYLALTRRAPKGVDVVVLFSWLSLLNVVAGPLDWYYANVLPYLYANLCLALQHRLGARLKRLALVLVCAQVGLFVSTAMGFIPFKVVLIR